MESLTVTLPTEAVAAIVAEVTANVLAQLGNSASSPWMSRAEAADYIGVSLSSLEKRRDIPHVKDRSRVLYHRDALDAWLLDRHDGDWTSGR